jgi:hypothetical protein
MGHFGFSYVGFVFLLMLIVPNLIWTKYQPKEFEFKDENKVLLVFERVGQVGVTFTTLVFSNLILTIGRFGVSADCGICPHDSV